MAFENIYLARQPIVTADLELYGFELAFRTLGEEGPDGPAGSSSLMANILTDFGLERVTGQSWAFFNVDTEFLMGDLVHALPKDKVVFQIVGRTEVDAALIERCQSLRRMGYRLALDDIFRSNNRNFDLIQAVDIVKVDLAALEPELMGGLIKRLKHYPIKLIAKNVDEQKRFTSSRTEGFDFFQGFHFARPQLVVAKRANPAKAALLRLLSLAMSDVTISEIEAELKRHPMLSVNLLRLVNSAGFGMTQPVGSIRHALLLMGRKQLQIWIQLLLYTSDRQKKSLSSPFLQLAATRGKLMEQLAEHAPGKPNDYKEAAFVTGILSLMDALLEMPFNDITQQLRLPDSIQQALLSRQGDLGKLLNLTERLEQEDGDIAQMQREYPDLPVNLLSTMMLTAYGWANELVEAA